MYRTRSTSRSLLAGSSMLALAAALSLPNGVMAQQQQQTPPAQQTQQQSEQGTGTQQSAPTAPQTEQQPGSQLAAIPHDELIGMEVRDATGADLGDVEEVRDVGGRIEAVAVDVGGFLGIGSKRVAIPAEQIQVREDHLQVQMTSEEVERLPEIEG